MRVKAAVLSVGEKRKRKRLKMSEERKEWFREFLRKQCACDTATYFPLSSFFEAEQAYNEAHPCKTDYTGCHPEIAESLKRGEHIPCILDVCAAHIGLRNHKMTVTAYESDKKHPYRASDGSLWAFAKPLPKTEKRVIGKVPMMQGFEANGFELNKKTGHFNNKSMCGYDLEIFKECGEKPRENAIYEPWMIEEVEIDDNYKVVQFRVLPL